MSDYIVDMPSSEELKKRSKCAESPMILSAYVVTRIVYEIIKLYMMNNTPASSGVTLTQKYDPEYTKSDILLDIGYNWRTKDLNKVPAVFVQREDMTLKAPTLGQNFSLDVKGGSENRFVLCNLPITISCVAAEPIAVVENLAEYIKQPLLYYRKEIQGDFGIRQFRLDEVTKPKLLPEGKNNFVVDLKLNVTFDDGWVIQRDSPRLNRLSLEIIDQLSVPLQQLSV